MASPPSGETLHATLLEDIRGKIVGGVWPPGRQLPKETALAETYGVSRMTMNKVLTQLSQEGYIIRRRRIGTFVAQARVQSAVVEINNIADEVAALGQPYRWRHLGSERRGLGQPDLHLLGVRRRAVAEEALVVRGLHYAGAAPFCAETRAINLAAVPAAAAQDFAGETPGAWLLRTMPWSTARHLVRAVNVAGRDARLLDLPEGAAGLEILRKTEHEGAWITYARLLYPGAAHQIVAEFEPRAPAPAPAPAARR